MADLTVLLPALRTEGATTGPVKLKLTDLGDGTFALATAGVNSPTAAVSSHSVFNQATKMSCLIVAGAVYAVYASNRNASDRYLLVFDTNNTTTGTPLFAFRILAGSLVIVGADFFKDKGVPLTTGLTLAISTSPASYVAATDADHDMSAIHS